nr:hypothetical protein [Microbacterium bovistercoris]
MRSRSPVPGIFIGIGGVVLAAWIAFGRALFGIAGELTLVYALTLGVIYAVLQVFLGRSVARTAQRGHRLRGATLGTLFASWGCAVLLGLMIPDVTPDGLQTILTGAAEPGRGIAIGFANPLGVIMLVLAVIALVLATSDAKGRADAPRVEEDEY